MVPRNDTLKINAHYLFVNKLIIAMLYYVALDRFTVEPSGCHARMFIPKMRSHKGSVKTIVQFVDELLPRSDIGA